MALRNHPRISAAQCARIQALADELGYRPDPLLSNLMVYLRTKKDAPYQATLAYFTGHTAPETWHGIFTFHEFHRGVVERARQLGYVVEIFWLQDPGLTSRRLSTILRNRGIRGIIVGPFRHGESFPDFPWKDFACCVVGSTIWKPALHCASNHHKDTMSRAFGELRALGYQRIGCAWTSGFDHAVDQSWLGAYLAEQHALPARMRVPILMRPDLDQKKFGAWLKKHRPDAVLGTQSPILLWLKNLGFRLPRDIGFASLDLFPSDDPALSPCAGIDQNSDIVGMSAVDLVTAQIQHNERGIPLHPKVVSIKGTWVGGPTVKKQPAR